MNDLGLLFEIRFSKSRPSIDVTYTNSLKANRGVAKKMCDRWFHRLISVGKKSW